MKHDPRPEYNPRQRDVPKEESAKTDTPQTTPREEWESELIEKYRTVCHPDVSAKIISDARTAAYEKGVRDSLEVIEETLRNLPPRAYSRLQVEELRKAIARFLK